MTSTARSSLTSRAANAVPSAESGGAVSALPPVSAPKLSAARIRWSAALLLCLALLVFSGCGEHKTDPKAEAPPPAIVEPDLIPNTFNVNHPHQFPLVFAIDHQPAPPLNVTVAL